MSFYIDKKEQIKQILQWRKLNYNTENYFSKEHKRLFKTFLKTIYQQFWRKIKTMIYGQRVPLLGKVEGTSHLSKFCLKFVMLQ